MSLRSGTPPSSEAKMSFFTIRQNSERQDDTRRISAVLSVERGCIRSFSRTQKTRPAQSPPNLLLEYFFDLPDLFFNFPGPVFGFAFSLQVGIVRDFARLLFDFAFHFMKLAFNLIFRTRFHLFSPYSCSCLIKELNLRSPAPTELLFGVNKNRTWLQRLVVGLMWRLGVYVPGPLARTAVPVLKRSR